MSVIENAIKKLQASRAAAGGPEHAPAGTPAPGRRAEAAQPAAAPARSIVVDWEALRVAGLLPPPHQEREIAQQFRQIKRPLINSVLGRGAVSVAQGNVIMVTSAVPGEGKTFTSLNLALSLGLEEDLTVVLVDGDVVNPRISRLLGLEREPGLLDIITDSDKPLSSVIVGTDVPGLSFLPAGRADDNATELLSSARMREIVAQLGGHDAGRLVLIDSPPLLLTTESQALAQVAGQILLVVRADLTQQHVVLEAIGTLDQGKPVAMVLNQSMKHPHAGYYYPYGSSAGSRETPSGA